eukprot:TRINITY_DN7744_c1_g2_i1.p1 TRINITY_DN7744_c1_g2~~TRINITY_DN7744_c1_g2_i1.p1  ORF type:complete len:485 (+),score=80.05 TRINITY_DN7744_c1_g2_i1:289-1743(+)
MNQQRRPSHPPVAEATYTGDYDRTGARCGQGTMRWSDGGKYVGCWKDGSMSGEGCFYYANGDVYVGSFSDGVKSGNGCCRFASGDKYVGEYRADVEHGFGTYTWASGDSYAGYWKGGRMHGYGLVVHSNGDVYEGWHTDARRHGRGRLQRSDGPAYVGEWARGCRHGRGTLVLPCGSGYNGHWEDDEMSGEGTWFESGGARHTGVWARGGLHGAPFPTHPMAQKTTPGTPPEEGRKQPAAVPPSPPPAAPERGKLWWSRMLEEEPHTHAGWAEEGVSALQAECDTRLRPSGYDAADEAAALDAKAAEYAVSNAGPSLLSGPPAPTRPRVVEAYLQICAEQGVRANRTVVSSLPDGLTTHEVTHLDASRTYLGDKGALVFVRLFSSCPNVSRLELRDLQLGQEVLLALTTEGEKHPKIKAVDLSGNFVEHPAARALHRMICRNANIEHLHLAGCQVNQGLTRQIEERLKYNTCVNAHRLGTAMIP